MKKLLLYFLLFPSILSAQINESDTLKIKAGLSLSGFYQGGNVETLIYRAKTDLSFTLWKKWVFKNQNSYIYQAFGKEKADEDILVLNFLYLNPDRKVYPFALGFVSTNFRREIELRYLTGVGITFQALSKEDYWLKFSISSEYERTYFSKTSFNYPEYNGQETNNTLRGTIWANGKYKLFKGKMVFTHESYYQPSLEDANNYRWQADLGLELPIWTSFSFKISYRHTYENIVIENQKRQDQFLTMGFTLKNY